MLPDFLKHNFWFVEFNKLDLEQDRDFIIFQILNYGGLEDWKWLFSNYSIDAMRGVMKNSIATAWYRQSLGLWQEVLGATARPNRFSDMPTPEQHWM